MNIPLMPSSRVSAALIIGGLWLSLTSDSVSETKIPPRNEKQMLGSWIAHDDSAAEYLRVVLQDEGRGSVAYLLADGPPDVWEITSWKANGYITTIVAENASADGLPAKLILDSRHGFLKCTLAWGSTQREFRLVKEEVLLSRIQKLQALSKTNSLPKAGDPLRQTKPPQPAKTRKESQ